MALSGLLYKVSDRKLLHNIQKVYEYDITNFEKWVDYETKYFEHIDKKRSTSSKAQVYIFYQIYQN